MGERKGLVLLSQEGPGAEMAAGRWGQQGPDSKSLPNAPCKHHHLYHICNKGKNPIEPQNEGGTEPLFGIRVGRTLAQLLERDLQHPTALKPTALLC